MRTQIIERRLTRHFRDDLHLRVLTPDMETWKGLPIDRRHRYGWMHPMPLDDDADGELMVMFCPELIATTTHWLTDELLSEYLTVIECFIDALVANRGEPVEQTSLWVEEHLAEECPAALRLLSEVEVQAIDSGIVTV